MSMPAMAGMVPQLVPRESLQQANALLSLTRNGLTVLGPSLGAFLVVTVGPGWALAVDALTWALAALLLLSGADPAARPAGGGDLHDGRTSARAGPSSAASPGSGRSCSASAPST